MRRTGIMLAALISSAVVTASGAAAPLSIRDSFRIGTGGAAICSAQAVANDAGLIDMFDAGYSVTCRDAALPVGKLYKLKNAANPAARLVALRGKDAICSTPRAGTIEGLGKVEIVDCRLKEAEVGYRAYHFASGKTFFAAEGLVGYDSALRLGLRSIVADKSVPGEVSVATTGAGDPAAFARVQAGTLDPARALAEAYRRNNVGSYADAAEFFASVRSGGGDAPIGLAEALVNEALQKSNLGRYAEADSLFDSAAGQIGSDPIVARRLRNYRAMHLLNRTRPKEALEELAKPMPTASSQVSQGSAAAIGIDQATSKRLNAESNVAEQLGGGSDDLLPEEKGEILDGQALQLRGTALRLGGDFAGASAALRASDARIAAVRGGRVASVVWMRAQIAGDLAAIAEQTGNRAEADRLYREGVAMLDAGYPGSAALLNARARLAGYLARSDQLETAEAMFREIVDSRPDASNLPPSFARVLRPYLDILMKKGANPAATADIFKASQLMMRPGLAQTQAVLARELSGGSDEAARLFRQAVSLTRQVERSRVALARLQGLAKPMPEQLLRMRALLAELRQAEKDSLATQAALGSFPRYRAVSSEVLNLADLQKTLKDGEGYYRLTVVDDHVYALLATADWAKAVKLGATASMLNEQVDSLRETISTVEQGQMMTYAFDVALSHKLYAALFGPFDAQLPDVAHLIFEGDGAMLRLPPNLLVMDRASVDTYQRRFAADANAEFDFRGIKWFGRERDISTSVAPRSFVELRSAPPARGKKQYLGLGNNAVPATSGEGAKLIAASADRDCVLPMSTWQNPISASELKVAGDILARFDPQGVQVITGDGFTDTALEARGDLNEYRIVHFATHGVVTSPRAKCPTQPALLTSFGGEGSDGLLTFREIFDLDLDADLIILSACDTAGTATMAATKSAGLATGGDVALDGLVRAFVGAGGRLVVASHWPVPDAFDATGRLMTGLFSAAPGTATVTALRLSQLPLMDQADTSHPFYWSAFAAVGDGGIPVIRQSQLAQQAK